MKLYFNGCSHTFGDDLSNLTQAWPSLVAGKLQCSFVNDAVSGGTNDRIMYRTIKHIHEFDQFFIAWTYTSRFTRYRADNNHDVNFNPHLKHSMYGHNAEYSDYGRLHYKFWHNELYSFKLWLQDIILLQRFLEYNNKKYVMISATDNYINRWTSSWNNFSNSVQSLLCFDLMNDNQLLQEHNEIQSLVAQINCKNYIGWNNWCITELIKKFPVGPTGHLLEDGHVAVSNYILEHDSI